MNGKNWRVWALAGVFTLVVLCAARAEDAGKAEDFKGKAYDVKEKGAVAITLAFPAGKKAHLTVKSEKKSDVNLFVYDEAKKEVAKDDSPGPDCDVNFTPKEAGKYTIVLRNLGPGDNKSTLKVELAK